MRKPRQGITVTFLAKHYTGNRTERIRALAKAAGVELEPITPTRHGRGDVDQRARATNRRDTRPLTRDEVRRILELLFAQRGERYLRQLGLEP